MTRAAILQAALVAAFCLLPPSASALAESLVRSVPATQPSADTPAAEAPDADPAIRAPFFWEVTGPNGPSWLLGTVHVDVRARELPPIVHTRLEQATVAVFEADVRTLDPFAALAMAQYGAEGSLLDVLSPAQVEQLGVQIGNTIPKSMLVQFRPWFIMTLQLNAIAPPGTPLDMELVEAALERETPLAFLETWQQQLGALQAVPEAYMVDTVKHMLVDEAAAVTELDALLAAYRAGDAAAVEAIVLNPEELERSPEFFEGMMYARNEAWIPALLTRIEAGGAFVAVGVGHLIGERSVVDLLRAQGYAVERVTLE